MVVFWGVVSGGVGWESGGCVSEERDDVGGVDG